MAAVYLSEAPLPFLGFLSWRWCSNFVGSESGQIHLQTTNTTAEGGEGGVELEKMPLNTSHSEVNF